MGELVINGNVIVTDQTTINPGVDGNEYHDDGQGLQLGAAYEAPIGGSGFFLGAGGGLQFFGFESNNPVGTQDFYPQLSNDDASLLGAPANESGTCPNNSCFEEMNLNGVGLYAKGYAGYRPSFLQSRLSFQTGLELSQRWTPTGRAPIVYSDINGDTAYYDGQSNIGGITGVNFNLGSSFDVTPALAVGAGFYTELFGSTAYNNTGLSNPTTKSDDVFHNWGITLGATFRPGKLGEKFAPKKAEPTYTLADGQRDIDAYTKTWVEAHKADLEACHIDPATFDGEATPTATHDSKALPALESIISDAAGASLYYYIDADGSLTGLTTFADYAACETKMKPAAASAPAATTTGTQR